jgi:RNA polymerase sigma-70 factor (ECF subfamily)
VQGYGSTEITLECSPQSGSPLEEKEVAQDLTVLYKTYNKKIRTVIRKYFLEESTCDDIYQETFLKAMQSYSSLKKHDAVLPWLCSIAKNLCLMELRKRKQVVTISPTDFVGDEDNGSEFDVVLEANDINQTYQLECSLSLIRQSILEHKNETRKKVAEMFYINQQPIREIALATGMNSNTVLSHLHRFRMIVTDAILKIAEERDLLLH